jgi:hypothetical protein
LKQLAKIYEREQEKLDAQKAELERHRERLEKARANCDHEYAVKYEDGSYRCKECAEVLVPAPLCEIDEGYEGGSEYEDE